MLADLGRDAGRDAGPDAGRDAGRDTGRDAGRGSDIRPSQLIDHGNWRVNLLLFHTTRANIAAYVLVRAPLAALAERGWILFAFYVDKIVVSFGDLLNRLFREPDQA